MEDLIMKEELRIRPEYGTVCGFTGRWYVEHRFLKDDAYWNARYGKWMIIYVADSKKEAMEHIDKTPEWAKG